MSTSTATGMNIMEASSLAAIMSALAVEQMGNHAISSQQLKAYINTHLLPYL